MSTRVPQKIGSIEIHDALARGGMGVVYVGTQPILDRRVVVKGLRGDLTGDPSLVQRFHREAQAASTVQHANVVAVHDAFEWRGQPWIVQEFVDGDDLAAVLLHHGPFPPRIAALVALSIVRGLEEVHDRGIVHRDLKPSNVLLGRKGDVKVCDFGIALDHHGHGLTRTGFAIGTVPYMAPEQMLGDNVDFRSDLFAVGILLYEMLCGQVPFPVQDPSDDRSLVRRIQDQRYARVDRVRRGVPRALRRLTERCLRAKPRRRGGSTTELRRELERVLGHPSPSDVRTEVAGFLAPTWEIPTAREPARRIVARPSTDPETSRTTAPARGSAPRRPRGSRPRRRSAHPLRYALLGASLGVVFVLAWWAWQSLPTSAWMLPQALRFALGG